MEEEPVDRNFTTGSSHLTDKTPCVWILSWIEGWDSLKELDFTSEL